jgi:hypothetical protein
VYRLKYGHKYESINQINLQRKEKEWNKNKFVNLRISDGQRE